MLLVDANVLIDVIEDDPNWADWSARQLAAARRRGLLVINPIIYAEVSLAFDDAADLDHYLTDADFERRALPWEAAFLAGRAFLSYRQRSGTKTTPLPDFYIGAHAQAEGLTLLTRDVDRYKTYFPKVKLVAP